MPFFIFQDLQQIPKANDPNNTNITPLRFIMKIAIKQLKSNKNTLKSVSVLQYIFCFQSLLNKFEQEVQQQDSQMLNPQQNININISYNLAADKALKPLPAKKIHKYAKTQSNPPQHCDIDIKLNKKNGENNLRKSNQYKSLHQPKKSKKSKFTPLRNAQTPDIYADRRIKTQGPTAQNDLLSAFKKEKISQKHHKSIQAPVGKQSQTSKKNHSQPKIHKIKAGHVTSCTMPNWKKIALDVGQHTISQVIQPKKKRTQSHSTFIKNDKVVSKLLNMSMLASELGGSQPITSERKGNSSAHSKNLKEYMSSMDMRIIRCMQEDVPIFADKKEKGQPDLIRTILLTNHISLEELTRKMGKIQRAWRRYKQINKNHVINQYQKIFQQISTKLRKEKLADISDIVSSPQNHSSETHSLLFQNDGLASITKQRFIFPQNSNEENSFQNTQNIQWISSQNTGSLNETPQMQLNFPKYRELVNNDIEKRTKKPKQKIKQEQQQQWNIVNQRISNAMNFTTNLDTQLINDELFRQSRINQEWINNQFQQNNKDIDIFIDDVMGEKKENQVSISQEEFQRSSEPPQERQRREQPYEDSLQEEDQNQYDKTKYEPVTEQLPKEVLTPNQPFSLKVQNEPISMQMDSEPPIHHNPIDQVWISQNLMEDNVVRNYLDCGLNDFGINLNSRIMQIPELPQDQGEFQNTDLSSDQAIGVRFQQANFGLLRNQEQGENEDQPDFQKELKNEKIDNIVEDTIGFLICEFASDISVILKKSTGQAPIQKKQAPRVQGIPTNFNAITDYLTKFIKYIIKESSSIDKVIETINKDIGPSSLQILTYLRPESEQSIIHSTEHEEQSVQEDDGLFVVPADIYEEFQNHLEEQYKIENQKQMGPRMKAYFSFWHRCIFQSYNECLDYERPYGVQGKPYEWTTQTKIFRPIRKQNLVLHLHKAENRLLDLTSLVGGIIFQKSDSPFILAQLTQEQKHMMNQERLSRILATELLQSEQSWINYNDQMAELLVELSRMIEQKLFFQHGTQLKKLQRRRKMIAEESIVEEGVTFNIDQL